MNPQQTYQCSGLKLLLCLLVVLLSFVQTAEAQLSSKIYRTRVLYDSLTANNNRDFLYNNITITNLTSDSISVLVTITMPKGWQITTKNVLTVTLPPNQNTILNLRLLASQSKTAEWENVKVEYRLNSGIETLTDSFKVRVQEYYKFKATLLNPDYVLGAYQKDITFPVYVKNIGNTPKNFTIYYYNGLLNLSYKQPIQLNPGDDTTYFIPLRLTESQWSILRREEVKVQVSMEGGETINLLQEISKIGYMLKQHSSGYLDMPLQVETGMTYQGKDNFQYYGALHGRLDLSREDKLAFDIRSKTFTQGQVQDNDIYRVEYEGKHWSGAAGNVMELTDFVMDGYGAKLGYRGDNEDNKIGVYGLLKSRTGNNQLIGVNAQQVTNKGIVLQESAAANFDKGRELNSYLYKQTGIWAINKEMELKVTAGAGMEQTFKTLNNNANQKQWGTSLGYQYMWHNKKINVMSNVMYNSNSYPGVFKGQRVQLHDVRFLHNKSFIGGFYEYNLRKQNIYTDTALFSNVFNLKTENYGIRTGTSIKNNNISFSVGQQKQQQTDTGAHQNYVFTFLNLNASVIFNSKSYLTINSYVGKGQLQGYEGVPNTWVNSNQGTLQLYFTGLSARYDRGPYFYHEYIKYTQNPQKYRRLVLSPYAEFKLFRTALTIRSQFNYNKTLPNYSETSNLLGNIIYRNFKHGFDLTLTGISPINQKAVTPYVTASFRMWIHTPFVAVRKYYTLKMVLFKDEDTDGKLDDGEGPIAGQMLALNDNLFVSDERGYVIFKNIEKQDYKADFGYTSKIKGWIPQSGTLQTFAVNGNRTIYVPYKKSKVLNGKLSLVADKNSNLDFKLSNIKVTATGNDSLRQSYSTLTDENGEFYFNLPAGIYTVTLSEVAFDEQFKPTEFAQQADMINNDEKTLYFKIKQKRRSINIRKK